MQEQSPDNQAKTLVVSIQDIQLTDDQEAKIDAIRKEYRPQNEENAKELKSLVKEEVDQVQNVLTPEQKPKIRAILEERRDFKEESLAQRIAGLKQLDLTESETAKIAGIRDEFRPKLEESVKQLNGLLTDVQKKSREEAIEAGKPRREVLQALNLSSDQKTKLQTVAKELKDLVGDELAKIRGVLTAEQQETLKDLRAERRETVRDQIAHQIANLRDLDLTEQQKDRLMNIRQELRPKIQEAGNKLRASVREEVEKIVAVINPGGDVAERPQRVE
jgi:Spy/CpxP family protein refolding chaperone